METKTIGKEELKRRFTKLWEGYQKEVDDAREKATRLKGGPAGCLIMKLDDDEDTDITGFVIEETDEYVRAILVEGLDDVKILREGIYQIFIGSADEE